MKEAYMMSSAKILLVEDEDCIRELVRACLPPEYALVEVSDGAAALQAVKENRPDLIVLDWMIPIIDGISVLKRIKEDTATMTIPVLMLTAKASAREVNHALREGADDYLAKPFELDAFLDKVEALLKKKTRSSYGIAGFIK